MAPARRSYPHPRRKGSGVATSAPAMLALFILSAPMGQSFVMRPPSLQPHRTTAFTNSAPRVSSSSYAATVAARDASHTITHRYGRRRHNSMLQSVKSDDDNSSDSNDGSSSSNDEELPSDDALIRASSSGDAADDKLTVSDTSIIYGDDEDEDGDITDDDPYAQSAPSEFADNESPQSLTSMKALARQSRELNTSPLDWGGALSTLRSRVEDIESGKSTNPSTALFRTVSRERPNEAIGRFVREANPEVVAAMTGAVGSLLGSLSNPAMGVETIVQASSEKLGNLCFQLQMTGYMFRNAEYVLALKSLMNIQGEGTTLEEYRAAFQRIDKDGNGYLERDEIEAMLADVYEGKPPAFEVNTFLEFFDSNNDGRVSWEEFEEGFGVVTQINDNAESKGENKNGFRLPASTEDDEDDDEAEDLFGEPALSGTIQVELEDGKVIEVDAQEYVNDLKAQALELKRELAQEKGIDPKEMGIAENGDAGGSSFVNQAVPGPGSAGGIASYIASLQGDVKSLTQGISPEVVDSMKMLIEFVLEGGPDGGGNAAAAGKEKEMELPGSALQQLALWQLVIGYRLRETEATGEWRQMLE